MSATTPQRRSFLAALSAFVATPAALAAAPAIAAKVEPEPAEAPELLALGVELRARLATYRDAAARFTAAREHFERIKPTVPADLIVPPGAADRLGTRGLSAPETDIDGVLALPPRRIYDRKSLQVEIIVQDVSRATKEGRRLRRLVRLAKGYEAAREAAAQQAGYYDAEEAVRAAADAISILTHPLLQAEPVTLRGARILAEATAGVWEAREHTGGIGHTYAAGLGVHLARSLLRLEGGAQ